MPRNILTVNSGSSSLKLALYSLEDPARLLWKGAADAIGRPGGSLTITDAAGRTVLQEDASHETQSDALERADAKLRELTGAGPAAIGYRIVHGGPHLRTHCALTPQVLDTLRQAMHYAPLHIPPALSLIDTAHRLQPDVPAFACFDTAFHRTMPVEAVTYAIPARYREQGVQRYGFHGLSYESIVAALSPRIPPRLVVAHLGNGASLCAIADGVSMDTSMGLTPTGGIPMGTRTGDLDPGIVVFMARAAQLDSEALESTLNHDSGLQGIADASDMRELTKQADAGNADAKLALTIFCRDIAKTAAGYAAILGGLDCLVFTGGIGEHSSLVRERVCAHLGFLGIALDTASNQQHAATLSTPSSSVQVKVIPADEDGQIAKHVRRLMQPAQPARE